MKTFKQFTEQYTPKGTFNKIPGKDSGLLDRIKYNIVIMIILK